MPRRGSETVPWPMPMRKRIKLMEEPPPSVDASFCDDEALPPGIVFSDIQQKKWKIGKPIGRGSFGRIYLASDSIEGEVTKASARYVVKIEPHTNGPLFVEVHCLIRTAKADKVKAWRQRNKQKRLGMPVYIASGSFTDENTGVKYRFLVLPRYDIDLQKIIARTKVLDLKHVCVLAIQILDVLQYLHGKGYTHSDIKSSNLMLGFDAGKNRPLVKTLSFQKETKEVAVLSGRHRKVKSVKPRPSNYYDDEDFVVKQDIASDSEEDEECSDKKIASVKKRLRKMLTDKDSRTLHRQHAFNLRQLSNYVNYEDLNSSVCSDQSYQKLVDDFGNRNFIRASQELYREVTKTKTEYDSLDDIKKEAILSQSSGQIYLLDYGLASKFLDSEGNHKDFDMDARKAHDGTLEYSSRDSHIGAHSRRSDLETLGYNLLDWLTGCLPWKTTEVLTEPNLVHALKKNYMSDIKSFLKTCFKTEFYPQFLERYLQYVTSLDFKEKPDYDYCRSLFKSELLKNGYDKDVPLNFSEPIKSPMSRTMFGSKRFGKKSTPADYLARNDVKKSFERENVRSLEYDLKLELLKETLNTSSDGVRKPCTTRNFFVSDADLVARLKKSLLPCDLLGKKLSPKNLRSQKKNIKKRRGVRQRNSIGKFGNFMGSARQFTWAEILAGNPEDIIRKERNVTASADDDDGCKYKIRRLSKASDCSDNLQSPLLQKDYLHNMNPTYAMKQVFYAFKKKVTGRSPTDCDDKVDGLEGYTPAMIKVYKMKEKREALESQSSTQKDAVPDTRATRAQSSKISCLHNTNPTHATKEMVYAFKKKVTGRSPRDSEDEVDGLEGYTPAMIKVYKMKEKREAIESQSSTQKDAVPGTRATRAQKSRNEKKLEVTTKKTRKRAVSDSSCQSMDIDEDDKDTPRIPEKKLRFQQQAPLECHEKASRSRGSNLESKGKGRERSNRASRSTVEPMEIEETRSNRSRSNSKSSKKEVNAAGNKSTGRCRKSRSQTRQSEPIVNNRRRLRSSKRSK